MANLIYKIGDATNPDETGNIIIAHIVNNCPVAGAGFVIALIKKFAKWKEDYISSAKYKIALLGSNEKLLGQTHFHKPVDYPNVIVADMFGQNDVGWDEENNPPIRYLALAKAMDRVAKKALETNSTIISPKFGSGLAGGDWDIIETLIQEIWVNRGIDVVIYTIEEELFSQN